MAATLVRATKLGRRSATSGSGGKAKGLSWLERHGYPVPETWVLTSPQETWDREAIRDGLRPIMTEAGAYAIRSSADVEDGSERSYAGQFDSVLDVRGLDAAVGAVERVRAGARSERVATYGSRDGEPVRMSVLVQEMVPAVVSGVAFSANPVTGLAEVIIEAVCGSGESLVQDGATPERWVHAWGRFKATPIQPALAQSAAERIAEDLHAMARAYGAPVDVEWVWDGERVTYVQLRPITTIGSVSYYSNRFSREVLPGVILPLVWSVNIPIVNGAWIRLLEQLVGPIGLEPHDLAARIYSRAYFNMGALGTVFDSLGVPRESLEILSGTEGADGHMPRPRLSFKTLRHLPRVAAFAARNLRYATTANATLEALERQFADLAALLSLDHATAEQTLAALDRLRPIVEQTASLNVLTPLLSEAMNHLLARRLKRFGVEYSVVDFANRDSGDEGRDPSVALGELNRELAALPGEAAVAFATGGAAALHDRGDGARFLEKLDRFTERYGHFSDSGNDFSHVPWREDPSVIVRMIASSGDTRAATERITRDKLPGGRRTRRQFDRASRLQVLRERVSSFYTLCYGFHRPLYRRLSELAEGASWPAADASWPPFPDAIYYLDDAEARALVAGDSPGGAAGSATAAATASPAAGPAATAAALARQRAEEVGAVRDVAVPDVVFGDEPSAIQDVDADHLSGVATSSGRHTGRAVLIASASQAKPVREGDVLVVPYSDVAWTPLFSRAGAIIAESGGFLSHTSIVAREYGIPAVVSVNGAMRALHDGDLVTVDGYTGTITVADPGETTDEVTSA